MVTRVMVVAKSQGGAEEYVRRNVDGCGQNSPRSLTATVARDLDGWRGALPFVARGVDAPERTCDEWVDASERAALFDARQLALPVIA